MSASLMRSSNAASSRSAASSPSSSKAAASIAAGLRAAAGCGCFAPCNCATMTGVRALGVCSAGFSTSFNTEAAPAQPVQTINKWKAYNERDLNYRHRQVLNHFPTALGVDDLISRVETVLSGYGFTGDNSIACTNLCRDEVTTVLKDKIESAFGSSFNTNGLGGVLTCGVTGMGAGLSHSPICDNGRERYVFFSFPHIAIDSQGEIGSISRPGRAGRSCACGALAKALGEIKKEGYEANCKVPGVHDALDPEYSILKQRLARRMRYERTNLSDLTLASITAIAERTISNDLEFLIGQAVNTSKADYAVVTGVQIHNWAVDLTADGAPSLEFVAPTNVYVVINGQRIDLDLTRIPTLSPRQLMIMASASVGEPIDGTTLAFSKSTGTTLKELPLSYLVKKLGGASMTDVTEVSRNNDAVDMSDHELTSRWQTEIQRPSQGINQGDIQSAMDNHYISYSSFDEGKAVPEPVAASNGTH